MQCNTTRGHRVAAAGAIENITQISRLIQNNPPWHWDGSKTESVTLKITAVFIFGFFNSVMYFGINRLLCFPQTSFLPFIHLYFLLCFYSFSWTFCQTSFGNSLCIPKCPASVLSSVVLEVVPKLERFEVLSIWHPRCELIIISCHQESLPLAAHLCGGGFWLADLATIIFLKAHFTACWVMISIQTLPRDEKRNFKDLAQTEVLF